MNRKGVLKAISDERDFQEAEIDKEDRTDMFKLNMGSAIAAMLHNFLMALNTWYRDDEAHGYQDTLEYLRKVAGLIVDQGEQHGMPFRLWEGAIDKKKVVDGLKNLECSSSPHDYEKGGEDLENMKSELAKMLIESIQNSELNVQELKVDVPDDQDILSTGRIEVVIPDLVPKEVELNFGFSKEGVPENAFLEDLEFSDISAEKNRTYTLPNGCTFTIEKPLFLAVDESSMGGHCHRVYAEGGKCYYIHINESIMIEWQVGEEQPDIN